MRVLSTHLLLLLLAAAASASLQCVDPSGNSVDWYFIYKINDGNSYAYHDANSGGDTLQIAAGQLSDSSSPLSRTLDAMGSSSNAYTYYNDEIPDGAIDKHIYSDPGGHAKGGLAADGDGGVWLVHSLPKFPSLTGYWSSASLEFGQTFLCLSISNDAVNGVALQLKIMAPHIYATNMPDNLAGKYPGLRSLLAGGSSSDTNTYSFDAGHRFTSFAKSPGWGQDLYEDLVEPYLDVQPGFAWETWRREPFLPAYCPSQYKYTSVNVESMQIGQYSWHYTEDHAKWGVSLSSSKPYVCVCGTNRMQSQRERGGGGVCFEDSALFGALTAAIASADQCPSSWAMGTLAANPPQRSWYSSYGAAQSSSSSSSSNTVAAAVGASVGAVAAVSLVALAVLVVKYRRLRASTAAPPSSGLEEHLLE